MPVECILVNSGYITALLSGLWPQFSRLIFSTIFCIVREYFYHIVEGHLPFLRHMTINNRFCCIFFTVNLYFSCPNVEECVVSTEIDYCKKISTAYVPANMFL